MDTSTTYMEQDTSTTKQDTSITHMEQDYSTTRVEQDAPFRYADLPPELREQILEILLRTSDPIEPYVTSPNLESSIGILGVNQQTYNEASYVLYRKNAFVFNTVPRMRHWAQKRPNLTTATNAFITLAIGPAAELPRHWRPKTYKMLVLLKKACPDLKELYIEFRLWMGIVINKAGLRMIGTQVLNAGIRDLEVLKYHARRIIFNRMDFQAQLRTMLMNKHREPLEFVEPP
ncbi:MAG: hypothetical protein M1812_007597 [Candelaria pacifica]|nr:MAG: hypothetical protein M1812_007597 [Candelaria pacifica]